MNINFEIVAEMGKLTCQEKESAYLESLQLEQGMKA